MVNFNLSRKTSTCRYTYNARIVNPSLGYRDVLNKSRSLMYIDQHKKQKYIWLRGRDTCTDKDGGQGVRTASRKFKLHKTYVVTRITFICLGLICQTNFYQITKSVN